MLLEENCNSTFPNCMRLELRKIAYLFILTLNIRDRINIYSNWEIEIKRMNRVTRSCGSGFRFWPNLSVLVVFVRRSLKNSSNIVFKTIVDRFFHPKMQKRRSFAVWSRLFGASTRYLYLPISLPACSGELCAFSPTPPLDNRIALNNMANFLFVSCFRAIQLWRITLSS